MLRTTLVILTVLVLTSSTQVHGQTPSKKAIQKMRAKAIAYLRTAQNDNGSFAPKLGGPGVSALVVAGLLNNGMTVEDPLVAKTLAYMEKSVRDNGGIYDKFLANYTTSVAVMAFHEANKNGKYDTILKNATKFLKGIQTKGPESSSSFDGFGYDKGGQPDLSNSSFTVGCSRTVGCSCTCQSDTCKHFSSANTICSSKTLNEVFCALREQVSV